MPVVGCAKVDAVAKRYFFLLAGSETQFESRDDGTRAGGIDRARQHVQDPRRLVYWYSPNFLWVGRDIPGSLSLWNHQSLDLNHASDVE